MSPQEEGPVAFRVSVVGLPQKGLPVAIEATDKQRAGLAREHGLLSVKRFRADLLVERWKRDGVRVTGKVEADIEQECIVTLEPLAAGIREEVDALFVPENSPLATPRLDERGEILLSAEGADSPETFSGDEIDVGALAEEFFAMGIDSYPRKPGAVLEIAAPEDGAASPFDKLSALKQKL